MDVIAFDYRHGDGSVRRRSLTHWREAGLYLQGRDLATGMPRTFLKGRVVAYAEGVAELLSAPHPTMPDLPRRRAPSRDKPHVLFTGFPALQRATMEAHCIANELPVCKDVTQSCGFVVAGPNAGPAKMERARVAGKLVLSWPQLLRVIETGELPDDEAQDGVTNV